MRKSGVQRKAVGLEPAELPENQAFMKILKDHSGYAGKQSWRIRFFADSEVATAGT